MPRLGHPCRDLLGRATHRREPGRSRLFLRGIATLPIAVFLGAGSMIAIGQDPIAHDPGSARAHDADVIPGAELRLVLDESLLSIRARAVRLDTVLAAVAKEAGLALELAAPLPQLVTVAFADMPLHQALDRLLRGYGFVLQYAPDRVRSGATANRLWVFAGGIVDPSLRTAERADDDHGPDAALARLDSVAALAEGREPAFAAALAPDIADETMAVRLEAVYALGEIGDATSIALLELALADPDERVRSEAIDALAEAGGDAAVTLLATALTDPNPTLREDAVYALGEIGGDTSLRLLREAANDHDEIVREAARDILADRDPD